VKHNTQHKAQRSDWDSAAYIITYNELDHSLPACVPVSINFKSIKSITTARLKKDMVGYLDRLSFSGESL
jgi:hypothetical protein